MTLFPGVRVNFSRRGISTTFGVPGASINIGSQGAYLNTGIPGTGLYNRVRLDGGSQPSNSSVEPEYSHPEHPNIFIPEEIGAIRSGDNNTITSEGLKGIKETLLAAYKQKKSLQEEVETGEEALHKAERRLDFIKMIPFHKHLFKKTLQERELEFNECTSSLAEAKNQYKLCKVAIEVKFDPSLAPYYDQICHSFESLQSSQFCWDVTSSVQIDRVKERSSAATTIYRKPVSIKKSSLDFVESELPALQFVNANGADLYLFPAFMIAFRSKTDFALVDYHDLIIEYSNVRFVEEQTVPKDAALQGYTWKYVNKNGSRDMRFSNNYQIPILLYGEVHFASSQGLNEAYEFSNAESTQAFVAEFLKFKAAITGEPESSSREKSNVAPQSKISKKEALKIFGLNSKATLDEIKSAYYELIQKYHPDKVASLADEFKVIAEKKTKEINEAYSVLTS
jgi:hypothetical protein